MLTTDSAAGTCVAAFVLVAVIFTTVFVRHIPAAAVAVPAAVLLVALGLADAESSLDELRFMAPTIAFLAAMLIVADVCARSGVFAWIGTVLARRSRGSPRRLLGIVFVAAAATTAVLSIDTTIVLLTPIVMMTARAIGARVTPVGYASSHLANTASTLLPVSNLTNLLAFSATGLGFLHFTGLMLAPWLISIAVEYAVFRWYFAGRLAASGVQNPQDTTTQTDEQTAAPAFFLIALACLLVGFVAAEPLDIPLYVVAWIGAAVMIVPALRRRPLLTVKSSARAVNIGFLAFVAALGIIVLPVRKGQLGDVVATLIPSGTGLLTLLVVAVIGTVLANLLNNLPATLLLLPLLSGRPELLLAMLLGVNLGPNLAYFGSLANLLWRDIMRRQRSAPTSPEYLRLGLCTVPSTLVVAVIALWAGLQV